MNIGGFGDGAIAAFIIFILGGISSLIYQKWTQKKQRIVYKLDVTSIQVKALTAEDSILNRITVLYDDVPITALYSYKVHLENAGNLAVKGQTMLFKFNKSAMPIHRPIVEHAPLVGPVEILSQENDPYQVTYCIGLLTVKQRVTFNFLTRDHEEPKIEIAGRNENNPETELLEQSSQKIKTLNDHMQRLIVLALIYFVMSPLISAFPLAFGAGIKLFSEQIVLLLRALLILLAYPSIKYIITEWLQRKAETTAKIMASGVESVAIGKNVAGSIIITGNENRIFHGELRDAIKILKQIEETPGK